MKKIIFLIVLLTVSPQIHAQFEFAIETRAYLSDKGKNPFWLYTNQKGRVDQESDVLFLANTQYTTHLNKSSTFEVKAGAFFQNGIENNIQIDELYAEYTYKIGRVTVGAKHFPDRFLGLSSVNGAILRSNNARALPGINFETVHPVRLMPWLSVEGNIANYFLEEDRFVSNAYLHHKSLQLNLHITSRDIVSGKLDHYVQWGGTSPVRGKQPNSFKDFARIFFGTPGNKRATDSDQINALGNSIGSYEFKYHMLRDRYNLTFYHQTLFEDASGRELNNFPDGVWGAFINLKKPESLISAFLLEYVQTVSQSGRKVGDNSVRGGDNYFNNSTYQSGWTYKSRLLGLPFFTIDEETGIGIENNRIYALHTGVVGHFANINYRLKGSYVESLGTYAEPYSYHRKNIYTYADFNYTTNYGIFSLYTGIDFNNRGESLDTFGLGLGYKYSF